jgi:hypothetical protein
MFSGEKPDCNNNTPNQSRCLDRMKKTIRHNNYNLNRDGKEGVEVSRG